MKGEQIENEHLLSIADDFYQLCDSCHPYLYKKCAQELIIYDYYTSDANWQGYDALLSIRQNEMIV